MDHVVHDRTQTFELNGSSPPGVARGEKESAAPTASSMSLVRGRRIALVRYDVYTRGSDVMADMLADCLEKEGAHVDIYHAKGRFKTLFPLNRSRYRALSMGMAPSVLIETTIRDWEVYDYLIADFAPIVLSLGLRHRRRLVFFAQNHDPVYYGNRLLSSAARRMCEITLRRWRVPVFCSSRQLADVLRTEYGADPVIIQQGEWKRLLAFEGIQAAEEEPVPRQKARVVLGIAARTHVKGADVLGKTFCALHRTRGSDVECWCVGHELPSGFDGAEIRRFGTVDHARLKQLYHSADAFVFTSRFENFPAPPFEAMVCGCPVVSTPVADYLSDNHNCLLVPRADPDQLAAAVNRVLGDSALASRLIQGGHDTVRQAKAMVAEMRSPAEDAAECLARLESCNTEQTS